MDLRRTAVTALTSYASAISLVITGLIGIRLATHSLSKEEFGAWSFVFSTLGYLFLLDFGVSSSTARMLGEPMAGRNSDEVSRWASMSFWVMCGQGAVMFAVGWALRDWVLAFSGVEGRLYEELTKLWNAVLAIRAAFHPTSLLAAVLFAQNRVHQQNIVFGLGGWVQVAAFYVGLDVLHLGILAYALSLLVSNVFNTLGWSLAVFLGPVRLRIRWSALPWEKFRQMLGFSSGVFAVQLSTQAAALTQTVIVTGILGLEAAAVFAVTSRLAVFSASFIGRPFAAFSPRWQHMHCEDGQAFRWKNEFILMSRFTACFAAVVATGILVANVPFIRWWTKPDFAAVPWVTVFLAASLWLQPVIACSTAVFNNTCKLTGFAVAKVLAAGFEIGAGIILTKMLGLVGVPLAATLAAFCLFVFAFRHAGRIVHWPLFRMFFPDAPWWIPSLAVGTLLCLSDFTKWLSLSPMAEFFVAGAAGALVALPVCWKAWQLLRSVRPTN